MSYRERSKGLSVQATNFQQSFSMVDPHFQSSRCVPSMTQLKVLYCQKSGFVWLMSNPSHRLGQTVKDHWSVGQTSYTCIVVVSNTHQYLTDHWHSLRLFVVFIFLGKFTKFSSSWIPRLIPNAMYICVLCTLRTFIFLKKKPFQPDSLFSA